MNQGVITRAEITDAKRKDWTAEKKRLEDIAHFAAMDYELAPNGAFQFVNKNLHYHTVINNLVEHARSKNKFKLLFFGIVKAAGIQVSLADVPAVDLKELGAQKKQAKEEVTLEAAEKIAKAPGVAPEEVPDLEEKANRNELDEKDAARLRKYQLYETYNLRENYEMSADFVLNYDTRQAKRQFYILNAAARLGSFDKLKESLLNGRFLNHEDILVGADNANHRTAFAIGLLNECGIDSSDYRFDNVEAQPIVDFKASLSSVPAYVKSFGVEFFKCLYPEHSSRAANKFDTIDEWKYTTILPFVNKILLAEFGVSFGAQSNSKKERNNIVISLPSLFLLRGERYIVDV